MDVRGFRQEICPRHDAAAVLFFLLDAHTEVGPCDVLKLKLDYYSSGGGFHI